MSASAVEAEPPVRVQSPQRRSALAFILAFAAGATDAFAFLLLGGVFTANMTGNLVLAGLTQRAGYATMIAGIIVAILAFCLALYVAFRIAYPGAPLPRLVAVLAVALLSQVAVLLAWLFAPDRGNPVMLAALIGLSAVAMASQTAVARRIELRSGVTTTYVTGTLTSLMNDLADRKPQAWITRTGVVFALVLGALSGSLLIGVDPAFGAALPVVAAAAGTGLLFSARWERRPAS